jgi:hypothetical protein
MYAPKDVVFFNGQRLRFVPGKDGQLYAFTSVKGLETFLHEQLGELVQSGTDFIPETLRTYGSYLYKDVAFLGTSIPLTVNQGNPDLGSMKNQVSSLMNIYGYETFLFDYVDYGGDYYAFAMPGGSPDYYYYALWPYGWNDRADSAVCFTW